MKVRYTSPISRQGGLSSERSKWHRPPMVPTPHLSGPAFGTIAEEVSMVELGKCMGASMDEAGRVGQTRLE